ncbi:MAG: S1C family serine protease [Clostridia bacterium]|nr:S1C family serine protease [Clostridia bacterium]
MIKGRFRRLFLPIAVMCVCIAIALCGCSLLDSLVGSDSEINNKVQYLDSVNNATVGNIVANNCLGAAVQVYAGNSAGSGFFVTADGYIVTNHHVVSGKTECTIRDANGQTVKASLVASDAKRDVALLKADTEGRDYLYFASSGSKENIYVGDTVYIIGNPADLGIIVGTGIVSNLSVYSGSDDRNYSFNSIIVNASINHGNSGGPMINAKGAVVGLIYARFESSSANGAQNNDIYGLACAVPSTAVMAFLGEQGVSYATAPPYQAPTE